MVWRTKEEKQCLLEEYRLSNESIDSFCKRRNISPSSFSLWRSKEKRSKSEAIRLLPVISSVQNQQEVFELMMPKGMSLRFSQGASPHYVADIIKAIAW
jgi:transposase-like protein